VTWHLVLWTEVCQHISMIERKLYSRRSTNKTNSLEKDDSACANQCPLNVYVDVTMNSEWRSLFTFTSFSLHIGLMESDLSVVQRHDTYHPGGQARAVDSTPTTIIIHSVISATRVFLVRFSVVHCGIWQRSRDAVGNKEAVEDMLAIDSSPRQTRPEKICETLLLPTT